MSHAIETNGGGAETELASPTSPSGAVMCTGLGRKGNELVVESTGEADTNNDGKHAFHCGVQRADDAIDFLFFH